ncbi:hypothetical protein K1719_016737 [Acacia pycnantha]|nr:hypothetical protein K1719_016737 [Acacia pycnantha]
MADNGFKSGYANALRDHDGGQATGCGIKATPHITSRLKTLKRLWQMAYDIIYGPNTSGFGWDPETKLVTADDDVWEEYLKELGITMEDVEAFRKHRETLRRGGRGRRFKDTTNDPNAYDEYAEAAKWKREVEAKETRRSKRAGKKKQQTPVTGKRKNPSDDHAHSMSDSSPKKKKTKPEDDRKGRAKWLMLVPVGKTKSGKPQTQNQQTGKEESAKEASPAPAPGPSSRDPSFEEGVAEVGAMFAKIVDEKLGLLKTDLHSTLNEMESRLRAMALDLKDRPEQEGHNEGDGENNDEADDDSKTEEGGEEEGDGGSDDEEEDHDEGEEDNSTTEEGEKEGDGVSDDEPEDDMRVEEEGDQEGDSVNDSEHEGGDESMTEEEGEEEGDGENDSEHEGGNDSMPEEGGEEEGDGENDSEHEGGDDSMPEEGGEEEGDGENDSEHEGGHDSMPEDGGEEEGDDEHEGRDHSSEMKNRRKEGMVMK